jgi:hypothetical protein
VLHPQPAGRGHRRAPGPAPRPHPVEDRVKTLKATGASRLPFGAFAAHAAWLELALTAHDVLSDSS